MSPPSPVRQRLAAVGAACALLLAATQPAAASSEVGADPAVIEAERRAEEAEWRLAEATVSLDAAAAAYEEAAAQHARLVEELRGAEQIVELAEAEIGDAEDALADRLSELYRRPYETVAVVEALAVGDDVASTLHAAALLEHAAERGMHDVARTRRDGGLAVDGIRQHHVVAAGTRAAAAARQAAAEALSRTVADATAALERAQEDAAAARTAAEERLEAERRAAEAALLSQTAFGGPPPMVDGRVCPIGAPNGFVDSWGFPRSGGRRHQGVDIFAAYGMPLYAVADGTVVRVGSGGLGGLSVWIEDGFGDRFYYAHLSAVAVKTGERVQVGQVVGANGDSGNARGGPPHLHWEYHPGGGAAVNPHSLAAALCRPA